MVFERDFLPLLIGLLFGAVLGVLVTDSPRTLLRRSPVPNDRRLVALRGYPRKLYLIIIISIIWALTLWALRLSFYGIIGSAVGFVASPWVWLHFSSDFLTKEERQSKEGENILSEYLGRYRLLTIVLGVILIFVMFGDRIFKYLDRANKIDFLGLSITVSTRSGASAVDSLVLPNPSSGNSAIETLSQNTYYARQVWAGKRKVTDIKADLENFDSLSIWDRDRAFIAYLIHSTNQQPYPTSLDSSLGLEKYINEARVDDLVNPGDREFLQLTSPFFACLDDYARQIRDIHLYFADTNPFLKDFSIVVTKLLRAKSVTSSAPTRAPLDLLMKDISQLSRSLATTIEQIGGDPTSCNAPQSWELELGGPLYTPSGITPYPILLAALSLAAVESPETGILYLADWLEPRDTTPSAGISARWYQLRAAIELRSLATQYIRPRLEAERLIRFQRQLTNEFFSLLSGTVKNWDSLCMGLKQGGMHAGIGRRLAFNYAVARNYVFELRTPAVLQRDGEQKKLDILDSIDRDILESTVLATSEDCYKGVPIFEKNRRKWIAQFELNIIQLRVGRVAVRLSMPAQAQSISDTDVFNEKDELSRILIAADAGLGVVDENAGTGRRDDQLLQSDGFDDQRGRINALKSVVSNLRKPE